MNLLSKQRQPNRHRKQTYGYQKGKEGDWGKLGIWVNRYLSISYIVISNKDLLYRKHSKLYSISYNNL